MNTRLLAILSAVLFLGACAKGEAPDDGTGGDAVDDLSNHSDSRSDSTTHDGSAVAIDADSATGDGISSRDGTTLDGSSDEQNNAADSDVVTSDVPRGCMATGCEDNNPCTMDVCDAVTGTCSHGTIANCCVDNGGCAASTACMISSCDLTTQRCQTAVPPGCCTPGTSANCYNGPAATQNVGTCHGGLSTCGADGMPGPCDGEVVPAAADSCGSGQDETCNGTTGEGCPPGNNDFASPIPITLGVGETTVTGTTTNATRDGNGVSCGCTSAGNVWYQFSLTGTEIVYIDTSGSSYDTSIWITDTAGNAIPAQPDNGQSGDGVCNDDSGCGVINEFGSQYQSRTWAQLAAGTYNISVSGCGTGDFALHLQHIPFSIGSYFYGTRLSGSSTIATYLVGASAATPTCTIGPSGEDVHWIATCGATQFFSLCSSDCDPGSGTCGTWTRAIGGVNHDSVMYLYSAQSGTQIWCNDDGPSMGGTTCTGTGGDSSNYGSRLNNVLVPRGIAAHFVDDRDAPNGMQYTMVYAIQ